VYLGFIGLEMVENLVHRGIKTPWWSCCHRCVSFRLFVAVQLLGCTEHLCVSGWQQYTS
jgi:hypothetical protein